MKLNVRYGKHALNEGRVGVIRDPGNYIGRHRRKKPNATLFEKQELSEKYRYRSNLLSAYAVIAGLQNQVEDDERNMRAARRQIELFMEDGKRERLTVALAAIEGRNPMQPYMLRKGGKKWLVALVNPRRLCGLATVCLPAKR